MTDHEIIRCIDDGANFYLRFFGSAIHMDYYKNDYYSYIRPKQGEHGVKFAFNVRLENLSESECLEKISELKSLNLPVWWDLQSSNDLYRLVHGKDKEKPAFHHLKNIELIEHQ